VIEAHAAEGAAEKWDGDHFATIYAAERIGELVASTRFVPRSAG
jgi:hypothetical protein